MNIFEDGTRVVLRKDYRGQKGHRPCSTGGGESSEWVGKDGFIPDEVYTVTGTNRCGCIYLEGTAYGHNPNHFRLAEDTPAWQPEPGEMVEVSDDGRYWDREPREFFAADGDLFVCRQPHSTCLFVSWPYVRPVKRLVTFGDGQEYMIDRETEERWLREVKGCEA